MTYRHDPDNGKAEQAERRRKRERDLVQWVTDELARRAETPDTTDPWEGLQ